MSFFGNPNIGVYAFVNNEVLIIPPGIGGDDVNEIVGVLKTPVVVEGKIAGTILNGVFISGNDNAIVLPRIIFEDELEKLKRALKESGAGPNVYVSTSRHTALGNILSCNNKGCIVSEGLEKDEIKKLSDVLGVEVVTARFLNIDIPGSLVLVNDFGGIVHPDLGDNDLKLLRDVLKVNVERATVNAGSPYVKSGALANNNGVVVGGNTTGPEVLRIEKGFEGGLT